MRGRMRLLFSLLRIATMRTCEPFITGYQAVEILKRVCLFRRTAALVSLTYKLFPEAKRLGCMLLLAAIFSFAARATVWLFLTQPGELIPSGTLDSLVPGLEFKNKQYILYMRV